jgi:thymidylate synthase
MNPDYQYLKLVKKVLKYGRLQDTRNSKTLSLFGNMMKFSLKNDKVPILTTKKLAWRSCLKELLWFMNGDTDNKSLQRQNVKIWNDNADRSFMLTRGLNYEIEGDLGPIYGHQWRFFNAEYSGCNSVYKGQGVDQLQNIIDSLKDDKEKHSRRLILSAWNPCQLDEMALPPCHVLSQFNVNSNDELSCLLFQRSGDLGLGVPFNIASYGFLTHILAKHCDLRPGYLIHTIGDAHIYENHIQPLREQVTRPFYNPPTLLINKKDCIDDYKFEDFEVKNYNYHPSIKMDMIA